MGDTSFARITQTERNIDIIDEDWVLDSLSDDEIEVLMEANMKPEDEEDIDDSGPEVVHEDIWDDSGLENITSADFSSTGNNLLGTYLSHSTRPFPEPKLPFMKEIMSFAGPGGATMNGANLLNDP